ncbi:hypothetical protein G6011_05201 [Alternaria panax]|uniref:Geranylgeranyl pyrophosphate synthetase n=1 Tax=Alternaria panax TaxID=48097 RepID=A0AAD4FCA9_9PLEO|nr:hypothetical protein G6011_05201 [Alternaria panax]
MDKSAFFEDLKLPRQSKYLGRPRASSDPVFSTSLVHGKHHIDKNTCKREYGGSDLETLAKQKGKEWYSHIYTNVNEDKIVWQGTFADIDPSPDSVSSLEGYTLVSSYSFVDEEKTTIAVPGSPPVFKRPNAKDFPLQIELDTGYYFMDEHAERAPKHQYEPAFQAIAVMSPDTRFNDVDIVINRTIVLNLIKFLKGASFQEFHLHLDFERNTLFVGRQVRNAKCRSERNSYCRNFEKAFTESEIDGATSHHRMLKYKFGSLTLVVRHEADAYDPTIMTPRDPDAPPGIHPSFPLDDHGAETMQDEDLRATSPEITPSPGDAVPSFTPATIVLLQGKVVPQHQIMELKSNTSSRPLDQMWFGRTPTYCLGGKHNAAFDGRYKRRDIRVKGVTQKGDTTDNHRGFENWEAGNQEVLQRLVTLLQLLRKTVEEKTEHQSAVLVAMSGNDMKVFETKKRVGALPKQMVERFWD